MSPTCPPSPSPGAGVLPAAQHARLDAGPRARLGDRHWESLENAVRHGVTIALGSDMPPHAEFDGTSATVRELEFMVEAGMTPHAALVAATSAGARWLDMDGEIGCVREGALADLVLVAGDPLRDISAMRDLRMVVKGAARSSTGGRDDRPGPPLPCDPKDHG
ncbi:amidohydrolase family protein [Streptomyces zhihengii]